MDSACLSTNGDRVLGHPVSVESSAWVALCLPENDGISRTLSEFPRFARGGDKGGLRAPLYSGDEVFSVDT